MNVFSVSKVLMVYVIESQVILNGNAGKVFDIQPFILSQDHSFDYYFLVSFATTNKVHVMSLYQTSAILQFNIEKPINSQITNTLPCISWNKLPKNIVTLSVSWGNLIQIYQLEEDSNRKLKYIKLHELNIDSSEVSSFQWLHNKVLVVLCSNDTIILIDPIAGNILEKVPCKYMELVYHTRLSLNNVTKYSYRDSMLSYSKSIYLLGLKGVYIIRLLNWEEQLAVLQSYFRYTEAIDLCIKFYNNETTLSIGLPDLSIRSQTVQQKLVDLLISWIDTLLLSKKKHLNHFKTCLHTIIDTLIKIQMLDVLFNDVFDRVKSTEFQDIYLESLEEFILCDKLTMLPPEIVQRLVDHYQSKHLLHKVEQCILHLHIATLDFHQVATLCKKYHLFLALIYIYNTGVKDYTTPLEYLLQEIQNATIPSTKQSLISVTTEYINGCLHGFSLTSTPLGSSQKEKARDDIFNYLFNNPRTHTLFA